MPILRIFKDFNSFKESLKNRNIDIDFKNLEKLDHENRELIQKERLEKEKRYFKIKDKSLFEKSKKFQ